jgi:hypothetical protein
VLLATAELLINSHHSVFLILQLLGEEGDLHGSGGWDLEKKYLTLFLPLLVPICASGNCTERLIDCPPLSFFTLQLLGLGDLHDSGGCNLEKNTI